MSDSPSTLEPLSAEHRSAYHNVLRKIVGAIDSRDSLKGSLGRHAKALVMRHYHALEAAKSGYDLTFDTRAEVTAFVKILWQYTHLIEEQFAPVSARAAEKYQRLQDSMQFDPYRTWTDEAGREMLTRTSTLGQLVREEVKDARQARESIRSLDVAAAEAIKLSTPIGLQFTLNALWEAYAGYYHKTNSLETVLIQAFEQGAEKAFGYFALVDARREELRLIAEAKIDAERAERARQALEEGDETSPRSGNFHRSEAYDWNRDDDDYFPAFNPANGLPMLNSCVDIHMNMYGTDGY